jgi:hypothetical protein
MIAPGNVGAASLDRPKIYHAWRERHNAGAYVIAANTMKMLWISKASLLLVESRRGDADRPGFVTKRS